MTSTVVCPFIYSYKDISNIRSHQYAIWFHPSLRKPKLARIPAKSRSFVLFIMQTYYLRKKIFDKIKKKDHSNIIFELEIKIKNRDKTLIKSVAWFFFKKKNF